MPDEIFGTSYDVDPKLFENEGYSTEGADNSGQTSAGQTEQNDTEPNTQQKDEAPKQDTPKLFAGKYKTPEDLEKAYLEAQKTLTQKTMELSQARRTPNPVQQDTSEQAQQNQQEFDWAAAYRQDPVRTTYLMIQSMLQESMGQFEPLKNNYEMNRVLDEVIGKYPDFNEYSEKAMDVLEKSPELFGLPNYLEIAYRLAKTEDLQTKAETAFEAGKNAAYNLDKQKNQKVFDNQTTRDEANPSPEDEIVKGIMKAGGAWRAFGI